MIINLANAGFQPRIGIDNASGKNPDSILALKSLLIPAFFAGLIAIALAINNEKSILAYKFCSIFIESFCGNICYFSISLTEGNQGYNELKCYPVFTDEARKLSCNDNYL